VSNGAENRDSDCRTQSGGKVDSGEHNTEEPLVATRLKPGSTERNGASQSRSPQNDPNDPHDPPDDGFGSEVEPETESGLRQLIRDHRRPLLAALFLGIAIIFVFVVLPQVAGFSKSLHRLRDGNKAWLAAGVGFECVSLAGYMALFRMIFSAEGVRISWRSSYQITMAGTVATKLLAAGGAGGIALTVWALRAAGLPARAVARRMTSFEFLLYAVFMGSLIVFGGGVALGALTGPSRPALTVLPAAFGAFVIVLVLVLGIAADRGQRWLSALARRAKRSRRLLEKLSTIPRTLHDGVRTTSEILGRPRLGLLGAVVYWAFDIATLWAAFEAFGASPPIAVLVLAYFIGQLANALPLPGGIGGVEGGMIGSFIACGVSGSTAALAVIAYRLISFWLPILPGSIAYLRLRAAVAQWNEQQGEAVSEESSRG
jgi:putative heme transporter